VISLHIRTLLIQVRLSKHSQKVTRFIDQNRLPHLLFYGPPGTGKTSTILACAEKLYGNKKNNMVLELNASDERGIDVVREQIKNFASSQSIFRYFFLFSLSSSGYKMIILDEADAMTQVAQNALRRGKCLIHSL
jgi:replication factor C subunit 3/5